MNKRELGTTWEQKAKEFLQKNGVHIVAMNFRNHMGEIDLIGYDGEYLVFFEVKYRKNHARGYASEAVGYRKQQIICRVSDYYRMVHNISDRISVRFDVIAIQNEEIEWIKNAYPYVGY